MLFRSEATHTVTVELEEGDNTFTFWVYDLAGNRTEKEITITRIVEEPVEELVEEMVEEPAEEPIEE